MTLKRWIHICITLIIIAGISAPVHAEEGMIPLSELQKLNLTALGFEIGSNDLYNPNGVSLVDGIINLSGCTASFVSPEGLVLTNYHCGMRAIQAISDETNDYLKNGFMASDRSQEVEAKGYTVRLIEFYKDVSKEVLSVVKKKMSYAQRTKAIEKKIKEIETSIDKKYPGRRSSVAEMFLGKTYVLFVYTYLKDIRLVYAPPRSIGEYGGEEDNWMWPRHTGDFTFLRAYVGKDGKPADYSPDNIPFKPKKYLQIAPQGVKSEDLVFVLGYPGRTYRHRTSHFYALAEEIEKPFIVKYYTAIINILEDFAKNDRSIEIKLIPMLKGLWNSMKRNKGQLKAMKGLGLTEKKKKEEQEMQRFIDADPVLKKKYGTLLDDIKELFEQKRKYAPKDLILRTLRRVGLPLRTAFTVYESSIERKKKDTDRKGAYMDRNFKRTIMRLMMGFRNYYMAADKASLKTLLEPASTLEGDLEIAPLKEISANLDGFLDNAYANTKMTDQKVVESLLEKTRKELEQFDDPFMKLAISLYPEFEKWEARLDNEKGIEDKLMAQLIDVKMKFKGQSFIPDANSTLRLTYGRVRGYSPADAVQYTPFTTLTGVVEKNTGKPPFDATQKLVELYNNKELGSFIHPKLNDVPVCFLYNTDTTGGNSGSPVLNGKGELIGLNFDRAFEATVNDYAWAESYSRSIGVDVRYILWFLEKYDGAMHLLKEMNVK